MDIGNFSISSSFQMRRLRGQGFMRLSPKSHSEEGAGLGCDPGLTGASPVLQHQTQGLQKDEMQIVLTLKEASGVP